jgi:hypothetical protein
MELLIDGTLKAPFLKKASGDEMIRIRSDGIWAPDVLFSQWCNRLLPYFSRFFF